MNQELPTIIRIFNHSVCASKPQIPNQGPQVPLIYTLFSLLQETQSNILLMYTLKNNVSFTVLGLEVGFQEVFY